jgi:hypothetical protein
LIGEVRSHARTVSGLRCSPHGRRGAGLFPRWRGQSAYPNAT